MTKFGYVKSVLICIFIQGCQKTSVDLGGSSLSGAAKVSNPHSKSRAESDKVTESNFREIFAALLRESGASRNDISQAIFDTPEYLLLPPTKPGVGRSVNMKIIDDHFLTHTPEEVYSYGLCHPPRQREIKHGKGPVTIIVFPGFTGEFIPSDPFEEILANQNSLFAKKMAPILAGLTDTVYQVRDQRYHKVKMSEVIRVGSFDRKGLPWVNIMVLTPKLGSLESLGKIRPLSEIYARRLHKILHNTRGVDSLGEIYLLGYSRGMVTGLDFLRHMSEQPARQYPWFSRVRGIVSLGGALYGAQSPDRALSGDDSGDSKTVKILRSFISEIQTAPAPSLAGKAYGIEVASRVSKNMATWTRLMAQMNAIGREPGQKSTASLLLAAEEALRHSGDFPEKPGIMSNFETFKSVLFDLLTMQCPVQCYFQNIKAFQQIIQAFIAGIEELTTESRLEWWRVANLPPRFRILSMTATMPGPPVNGRLSPLLSSPYIGYRSPDFVSMLRPGYYSSLESGAGTLNDSSMSVARARYWPQLDSASGRRHDYLGIVGAHHYGLAFPFAVADKYRRPNPFPRSVLLGAIGSYLREYPHESKP